MYDLVHPLLHLQIQNPMQRREFLKLSTAALAASAVNTSAIANQGPAENKSNDAVTFYISRRGNDRNAGTSSAPFATLHRAQLAMVSSNLFILFSLLEAGVVGVC